MEQDFWGGGRYWGDGGKAIQEVTSILYFEGRGAGQATKGRKAREKKTSKGTLTFTKENSRDLVTWYSRGLKGRFLYPVDMRIGNNIQSDHMRS